MLQYYTTKNWTFKNENFLKMKERMSPLDLQKFSFSVEEVILNHNVASFEFSDWILRHFFSPID